VAEAVDRRIIQAQDGNCAADFEVHVTHTPTRIPDEPLIA
jgi:hypothetical protein